MSLDRLPLPDAPTFNDLVFRPHPDGNQSHFQALHSFRDGVLSVTLGGRNSGVPDAPYEAQTPDGEIHAPLTADGVSELLRTYDATAPSP